MAVVASLKRVQGWCQAADVSYPMLADDEHQVSAAYGIYDLLGTGRAMPSAFIIDTDGRIVWHYVGQSPNEYIPAQTLLENLGMVSASR